MKNNYKLPKCHDLNLGLTIKARAYKDACQASSPKITFRVPKNIGKWEGMNPHIPRWVFTLGIGFLIFPKKNCRGQNSLD
jgi:hypothetical protein